MKHFTLILAFIATTALSITSSAQTTLTTAVDFTITDLEGNSHNLFDYLDAGQYVCIDFYAYWCGPCQATAPEFTNVYHQYGCNDGEVTFLSIEYEGSDAQAHDFEVAWAGDNPPPTASGIEGLGGAVHSSYGIGAFPTYILINPGGQIVEQDIWPMDASILDDVLQSYNLSYMSCTNSVEESVLEFAVYPVPATDFVNVELADTGASIELINILGATVITTVATEYRTQLDVSALEVGSYFVRITEQGAVRTQAIQIVR
jgi:thiol-disulfide isomerase/thioredoxin